jgi:hypothetical protein
MGRSAVRNAHTTASATTSTPTWRTTLRGLFGRVCADWIRGVVVVLTWSASGAA